MKSLTIKILSYLIFTLLTLSLVACKSSTPTITPNNDTTQTTPASDTTKVAPDNEATPVTPNSDTTETPGSDTTKRATPASPAASTLSTSPLFDTAWDDRSIFRPGLISMEQETLDHLPGASVYHIDFQISDDLLLLIGQEEVHYSTYAVGCLNVISRRFLPRNPHKLVLHA